jgi:hypothetical protein
MQCATANCSQLFPLPSDFKQTGCSASGRSRAFLTQEVAERSDGQAMAWSANHPLTVSEAPATRSAMTAIAAMGLRFLPLIWLSCASSRVIE